MGEEGFRSGRLEPAAGSLSLKHPLARAHTENHPLVLLPQSLRLDLWGASRKSELLSKVARIPVEVVAPDGTVISQEDADDEQPD